MCNHVTPELGASCHPNSITTSLEADSSRHHEQTHKPRERLAAFEIRLLQNKADVSQDIVPDLALNSRVRLSHLGITGSG